MFHIVFRYEIISGKSEPTEEELEGFTGTQDEPQSPGENRGVPYFWLTVLRSHSTVAEYVTKVRESYMKTLVQRAKSALSVPCHEPGAGALKCSSKYAEPSPLPAHEAY
jgi:hypothetical protein